MVERLLKVWWLVVKPPVDFASCQAVSASARPVVWQERMLSSMMQSFDWRGALEMCHEVLQDDPDHLGALETLAKAQWLGGQYKEVIHTINHLLRLNPHEPGYRYTRGMAYMSMGQLRRSADDLRFAYAQSKDLSFRSQVGSALEAVELWLSEEPSRGSKDQRISLVDGTYTGSFTSMRVH